MNVEELQKLLDVAIFKGCISAVFFANLLFAWTLSQAKSRSNGDSDE